MSVYIINIIMIGIYSLLYNLINKKNWYKNNKKLKMIFVFLVTIQLFLILALRKSSVGVDIRGYVRQFIFVRHASLDEILLLRHEIGYKLLVKLISFLTGNPQMFLAIISGISIIPIGRLIYKYSRMPFLSFALYISFNFYAFVFSGLRQAIAISIICISYDYIREQKPLKFILTVIIASLFHKSAMFFLPAYIIAKIKLNKKSLMTLLLGNMIIYIFRIEIMGFITTYVFDSFDIIESNSYTWFLFNLFIYILCLVFYKSTIERNYKSNELYLLVAIGISLMLFATVSNNAMRIANYYHIFIILLIPEVIYSIKDKKMVLLGLYILLLGNITLSFWQLYTDGYKIVPYEFFWK